MEICEVITRSQLDKFVQNLSDLTVRETVKFETIEKIVNKTKSEKNKKTDCDVECLTACVRVLRNLVAGVKRNQIVTAELLNSTYDIWDIIFLCLEEIDGGNSSYLPLLRCTIQLVGNLAVDHTTFQADNLWKITSASEQIFLRSSDLRSKNYMCMVLFNVIQNQKLFPILEETQEFSRGRVEYARQITNFLPIWMDLLQSQEDDDCGVEFALYCLEGLVCSTNYFTLLDMDQRMSLLDILLNLLEKNDARIPTQNIIIFANDFNKKSDVILTTNYGSVDQLDPKHISNLLLILATATSQERHRPKMQDEKSLLLNALYLLRMVHMAGKEGVESHVPISKMSELTNNNNKDKVEQNPTYGFKANLIRLLANLCWNHPQNKTLVGELEGVALILDCSQLDGRNPLITQWVVLAVKCLLFDHPANQAVLLALRREGAADQALLRELGIHFDVDGKIKIEKKQ